MKKIISGVISLIIIFLVFRGVNWNEFMFSLKNINRSAVLAAISLYFLGNLVTSYRIYSGLKIFNKKLKLLKILRANFSAMLVSDITPGRSGYFAIIYFLKDKVEVEVMAGLVTFTQAIDFIIKAVGSVIAIYFFSSALLNKTVLYEGALLMLSFALALLLLLFSKQSLKLLNIIKLKSVAQRMGTVQAEGHKIKTKFIFFAFLGFIGWIIRGVQWYFIAISIGMEKSFIFFFLLHPVATAISFVPITIAGIGFQESVLVGFLYLFDIDYSKALLFGVLTRALDVLVDFIFGFRRSYFPSSRQQVQ